MKGGWMIAPELILWMVYKLKVKLCMEGEVYNKINNQRLNLNNTYEINYLFQQSQTNNRQHLSASPDQYKWVSSVLTLLV